MNAGLAHGFKRGYITTIGLILGIMTQLLLVSVGLGALVASSNMALDRQAVRQRPSRHAM